MNHNESLYKYTLQLGDSSLVLAQRLSEWTGHGPFLEEDLALTNIALDIFGRAKNLLEYAAKIDGKGKSEDDLAFLRSDREFLNVLLTELPNGDYAKTILRQAFLDCFDVLFYTELCQSKDITLAAIAAKTLKEVVYHKRHSFSWVNRFGNGTEESMTRLQNAYNEIWEYSGELFEMSEAETNLLKDGISVDLNKLKTLWEKEITGVLKNANVVLIENSYMHSGGKKGFHTEHLGHLLAEMQALPRAYPDAKW